jgi:hypothetical protein
MEDVRVFRRATCGSDHCLVRAKIIFPWIYSTNSNAETNLNVQHIQEEDRIDVELFQDDSIRNLYSRRLENALNEEFEGSTEELYEYVKCTMRKIAQEAASVKRKKNYRTNWMTTEVL